MTFLHVLAIIAVAQGAFLVFLTVALLGHRAVVRRARVRRVVVSREVSVPLQEWMLGIGPISSVATALREAPWQIALEEAALAASSRITTEQLDELAAVLRTEAWMVRVLSRFSASFWWRRLDAARALAIVGEPAHKPMLRRLLGDPHVAVRTAAASALIRVRDPQLVAEMLDSLHLEPEAIRRHHLGVLHALWRIATPLLRERLAAPASAAQQAFWVRLAEMSGDADAMQRAAALYDHPDPEVRSAVASLLREYFHPSSVERLRTLLADPHPGVRARAARALGTIADPTTLPALAKALEDRSWWVRFRAALALAQRDEPGRAALRKAWDSPDRYARDMARMVSGLSDGGLVELSEE